jgi:serine protease Do
VSIDQTFTAEAAKQYNVPEGLLVYDVLPLSSAYKAGVHAGDIITKFDGKEVKVFSDLEDRKNTHKPGDTVSIEVYRDGKTLTLEAVLDEENNAE